MRALALGMIVTASTVMADPRVVSPEVYPKIRRVTFRQLAPKTAEVALWGEWIAKYNTVERMTRDVGGVWPGPLVR